ncbi:hypothetical protein ACZ11_01345 [Lysinibacillus xylanilyticus]|uniref:Uncharacterized protein n=1 Tax=Lysinibacillus xylanilyticus TaxID=582475 RepID=A0A0K9FGU9_9BACI|nr:hypothetical protein ACZ11_01345 [Lysinibacillus xylanilyticus]
MFHSGNKTTQYGEHAVSHSPALDVGKRVNALFLVKISVHINIKKIQTNFNVKILGGYLG